MRRWFIRGFVGLVLAAVAVAASLLDTTERPPAFSPPGYYVIDMTVPGRDGLVRLHLWYPTDSDAATVLVGQNGLFYGEHVRPEAPPVAGPLPVVVLSHGSGGNAERLGWLAGYLASQGMIVAAPDHPGSTSGDSDPFRMPLAWERIADLKATLDLLETAPPPGLQPDINRVASLGFSLGGIPHLGSAACGQAAMPSSPIASQSRRRRIACGWSRQGWISRPSTPRSTTPTIAICG